MEFTPATTSDIPQLCCLLELLFSQEVEFTANNEAQSKGLNQIISNPDKGRIIVAKEGDHVVGMINLLFTVSTALGERVALLEDMIVLPELRGTGIGSQLIEKGIELAQACGCKRITLLTDQNNTAAQRFYEKHGFSKSTMVLFRLMLND